MQRDIVLVKRKSLKDVRLREDGKVSSLLSCIQWILLCRYPASLQPPLTLTGEILRRRFDATPLTQWSTS